MFNKLFQCLTVFSLCLFLFFPNASQGQQSAAADYREYDIESLQALMQTDAPITLFPIWPLRVHPLVVKLRKMLDEGQFGPVQYLELEREITPAAATAPLRWLTSEEIDRAFLADVDLLRDLGGDYNLVTALRTGDEDQIASATTTLASPRPSWRSSNSCAPTSAPT